jgi:hypothetical protein
VRPDQRHVAVRITEREGEVLAPVDQPVEAEHPHVRLVTVGESQGQGDLRAYRRDGKWQRHPSSNRDDSA